MKTRSKSRHCVLSKPESFRVNGKMTFSFNKNNTWLCNFFMLTSHTGIPAAPLLGSPLWFKLFIHTKHRFKIIKTKISGTINGRVNYVYCLSSSQDYRIL